MGILLALALIAGGGVLGVVLGKKKAPVAERPTLPAVTTTPPIKTVHATTTVVDVIGTLTTTPTVTTTVFIAPSSGGRMGNSDD
jgi:cobalamin biosynthesis protein CobD/CbiB